MSFLLGWLIFSIAVGILANARGRNGGGWFFLSLLISPLLAGVIVLASGKQAGRTWRKCPSCAELVRREAVVCSHCRRDLPAPVVAAPRHVPAF
jgi:hypothetical protein